MDGGEGNDDAVEGLQFPLVFEEHVGSLPADCKRNIINFYSAHARNHMVKFNRRCFAVESIITTIGNTTDR